MESAAKWAQDMYSISDYDAERVVIAMGIDGCDDLPDNGGTIDNGHCDKIAGHNGYYATWDNGVGVLMTNGDPAWTDDWRNDSAWRDDCGLD